MILWSIQDKKVYEKLLDNKTIHLGREHKILFEEFETPYKWMIHQMRNRIGKEPEGVVYPIWSWYMWEGKRKRLDMRTHRNYGSPGSEIILLTLDVPDDKVLLSDFDYWHFVLNGSMLDFDNCSKEYTKKEIEQSWDGIFDCIDMNDKKYITAASIQATMWEIKPEWVKKAEIFKSRSNNDC